MKLKALIPYAALLIFAALPVGCAGQNNSVALFKPNTPPQLKQADLDSCKIASFKAIPQAITTEYVGGGYSTPGYIECRGHGRHGDRFCDQVGGYYTPPIAYSEDVNASLRWRFVSACLAKKGYYILYNKPACKNGADRARALSARTPDDLVCNPDASMLDY